MIKLPNKWGVNMSPFLVYKEIKNAKSNGERITIDELGRRCKERIRHRYLVMSKQMFECEQCGGFPRHWVKGLKLHSWFTLWFYKPPKQTDFSSVSVNSSELEAPISLKDYLDSKKDTDKKH